MRNDIITAFRLIANACKLWWQDWANQVLVSLLALLLSLTIVLAPASLMGIFQEMQDLSNGIRTGLIGFWQGFKRHFWRSLSFGLVNLLVLVVLAVNIWFYANIEAVWSPLLVVLLILLAFFWFMLQFFALGYLFEQDERSLRLAWHNSFLTILAAPFFTIVLSGFALIITVLSLGLILPLIIGTLPLVALLSLMGVRNRLETYKIRQPSFEGQNPEHNSNT